MSVIAWLQQLGVGFLIREWHFIVNSFAAVQSVTMQDSRLNLRGWKKSAIQNRKGRSPFGQSLP